MDILIIAPQQPDLQTSTEIARVASGNTATILDGHVSRGKLALTLQTHQFDIMHYAGHGTYDVLELSDGPVTADELQTMVQGQKRLKLIVLNSCLGAGTAAELHNLLNVPVVMYQAAASDPAAIRYAEVLYAGLLAKVPLHEAHDRACGSIRRTCPGLPDAQLPVLINGLMNEFPEFQTEVLMRLTRLEQQMRIVVERHTWQEFIPTALLFALLVMAVIDFFVKHN